MNPIETVLARLDRVRPSGELKWTARCPAHEDRSPSLSISEGEDGRVLLHCYAGCSTDALCAAMGIELQDLFPADNPRRAFGGRRRTAGEARRPTAPRLTFGPREARCTWTLARGRARDDECVEADRAVYDYMIRRRISEGWEQPGFGVLSQGMELPDQIRWWPGSGYRVVAPLYNLHGELVNVQARCILDGASRKVLVPTGSRCKGTVFANHSGRDLLEHGGGTPEVIILEGLTDFLAVGLATCAAVLSAPGTSAAESGVGEWADDRDIFIGVDLDDAGNACVEGLAAALFAAQARSVHRLVWPDKCVDACDTLAALGSRDFSEFLSDCLKGGERVAVA